MITSSFCLFLNHLLAQEPWAIRLLKQHADKVACFDVSLFQITVRIGSDGLLQTLTQAELESLAVNVKILVKPSDLPLILQNREHAVSYVKIEGDADFANTISQISQGLRWDVEENLSKVFGDIAAVRLVASGKQLISTAQKTHQHLQENLAEYFLEENPLLVRPSEVDIFSKQVVKTRDDVERFAKRIERLEKMGFENKRRIESEEK